ncbi:IS110 family transposase [Streptomyces griseorubiginosus]|uniref:IS110 family transposase n=1 Tax=Streptomyces griseorubiginosus TaxID=67304 RepID=UPI002E80EC6D|nr:IS110 family transposase [Streptomyces griseorubiginosus]WUB50295.1 IS110 family transposase [Streptomyces griseorubiginosus]
MHVVGIDGHKKTHTLVAVDPLGRRASEVTVPATPAGHAQAIKWIAQFGQVLLAIEDCRHLTRRFEADLLLAGHAVVRVHTRLMAGTRRSARERGKSDPIDAEAVARVALREPDLPRASLAGPTRDVKLLVDHRRCLVRNRTAAANKLRWFLHEIDPELPVPSRGLRRLCVFDALAAALAGREGVVVEIARDLIGECRRLTEQINALEARLRKLAETLAPSLLAIPGCGVISAAVIIGETAGAARFKSKDAFAHFTGTAPIPVWSSNKVRVRLNRGGNRSINHALHMIAVTQVRRGGEGADYFAKQRARGKTPKEAVRLLRRRISDRVFRALLADETAARPGLVPADLSVPLAA